MMQAGSTTLRIRGRLGRRRSCNGPEVRTPSTASTLVETASLRSETLITTARSARVRRSINCDIACFVALAGDLDLVVGHGYSLAYIENTGTSTAPAFVQRTGSAILFDGVDFSGDSMPALGDLDNDGTLSPRPSIHKL